MVDWSKIIIMTTTYCDKSKIKRVTRAPRMASENGSILL